MIIADTSVWIEHFRRPDQDLVELLQKEIILMHPFVSLELACGHLKNRNRILGDLKQIPAIEPASLSETAEFLEKQKLHGSGLGFVDVNLLATCYQNELYLYTFDSALKRHAQRLKRFSFR